MPDATTIIRFRPPGLITDPLTEIARDRARRRLMAALKAETDGFGARFSEDLRADGCQRMVRHGAGPERVIQTGTGPIEARRQKVRDRSVDVAAEVKVRFTSNILPKWARGSRSLDALLPWIWAVLYLRGISTGDFQEALSALLGTDAPNLSPGVIARLTAGWQQDHDRWQDCDLSARRYVYIWADGVYLQARMEPEAECILVIIGATPEGRKELLGLPVGIRESAPSWRELRVGVKARGLAIAPEVAVGDGALGFCKGGRRSVSGHPPSALLVLTKVRMFATSFPNPWPRRSRRTCKTSTLPKPRRRPWLASRSSPKNTGPNRHPPPLA